MRSISGTAGRRCGRSAARPVTDGRTRGWRPPASVSPTPADDEPIGFWYCTYCTTLMLLSRLSSTTHGRDGVSDAGRSGRLDDPRGAESENRRRRARDAARRAHGIRIRQVADRGRLGHRGQRAVLPLSRRGSARVGVRTSARGPTDGRLCEGRRQRVRCWYARGGRLRRRSPYGGHERLGVHLRGPRGHRLRGPRHAAAVPAALQWLSRLSHLRRERGGRDRPAPGVHRPVSRRRRRARRRADIRLRHPPTR